MTAQERKRVKKVIRFLHTGNQKDAMHTLMVLAYGGKRAKEMSFDVETNSMKRNVKNNA